MRPPAFWRAGLDPYSREAAPMLRVMLTPASWLTAQIHKRKLARTPTQSVPAKIISIGGLTVGGAGKTPFTQLLRQELESGSGRRIASLSRGYGGRLGKAPLKVEAAQHTAREVGDEPLLLSQTGESWIGRDKAAGAAAMSEAGVEIILMDDGHQSVGTQKDLSIVVLDGAAPFGNGFVFPKGPLREPARSGLLRADLVIWLGAGPVPQQLLDTGLPFFIGAKTLEADAPYSGSTIAFAGISDPYAFFDMLKGAGYALKEAIAYDNHYAYKARDLSFLERLAGDYNAQLVTTEKDWVRLPDACKPKVSAIPLRIKLDDRDGLMAAIEDRLQLKAPS